MDNFTLIIFGITGNLAQIKLIPALYDMEEKGLLMDSAKIIGNARKPMSVSEIREYFKSVLYSENKHHKHPIKMEVFERLIKRIIYIDGHLDDRDFYPRLDELIKSLEEREKIDNRIYYLATYPDLYKYIFENLKKSDMNKSKKGHVRLMIEKPIGNDLSSAQELNKLLKKYFAEDQIYRLDHYLGKETIQNILTFRFANSFLEPIYNWKHIDHIQITAAEDFGIGKRGGYYDSVGALKDVGQNHLLQMIAFATMKTPKSFSSKAIRKERTKILKELIAYPEKLVLGQYKDYRKEENVFADSLADTFFAFKTELKDSRFRNVPIYIRGGKKLKKTVTEISIVFKSPIKNLFHNIQGTEPNILVYRIQPNEAIVLKVVVKKPGMKIEFDPTYMQFCYRQDPNFHVLPDPYERLISDAIRSDQTFFNDAEEVEAQWKFIDELVSKNIQPITYNIGSWGPKEADKLIEADGRKWLEPSEDFCLI